MKFAFNVSPNLRQKQSTKQIMLELMIGLLVVFAFSLFYYGTEYGSSYVLQAIKLLAVSVIVALLTEIAFAFFTRKGQKIDFAYIKKFLSGSFGWITAIILTMMCPISISFYALGVATFFAIFFAKLLFGGFGNNIFNPAAVGRAVIFATFVGASTDIITMATPTTVIASSYNWLVVDPEMITTMMDEIGGLPTLFTGMYPGAIGETSALVILIVGIILSIRKVIDWRIPVVYLGSIFVLAMGIALFKGVGSYGSLPGFIWYPLLHLLTGGVMFGAVFMLTDPVTSPTSAQGKCIFALGAAVLTVLIRIKANLPEGCLYSILLMNMLTPMIEQALAGKQLALRKKASIIFGSVAVVGMGCVLLAANVIEPKAKEVEEAPQPTLVTSTDEDMLSMDASITDTKENGNEVVYTVKAHGYTANENPDVYNVFEITVDKTNNQITKMSFVECNDSDFIKTAVQSNPELVNVVNTDLSKEFEYTTEDVVSGATFTTKSAMRAMIEVQRALGL